MKGYKAFEKGLICKDKQYSENTVFEESDAIIHKKGMHFCVNPLDVLNYYPLVNEAGDFSDFAEVESLADTETDDNAKYCTTKLKIGEKLSFPRFLKACVDYLIETTIDKMLNGSAGGYARIGSSGQSAQIGSSGDYAQIGSSGDYAQIGSSGYAAQIGSSGDNCVICCAGRDSRVKAKKGSWITLSEWAYENKRYVPKCVKPEFVDGKNIKEDVFYQLINGEFTEISEENDRD